MKEKGFILWFCLLISLAHWTGAAKFECNVLDDSYASNTIDWQVKDVLHICQLIVDVTNRDEDDQMTNNASFTGVIVSNSTWKFIPKIIFNRLPLLKYLSIHNKSMQELKKEDFQDAGNLETLYIKGNPDLTELGPATFSNAKHLKYLNLMQNGLTVIHKEAFSGLKNLTEIYLMENFLFRIHGSTFNSLPSLAKVNFIGNSCINETLYRLLDISKKLIEQNCHYYYNQNEDIISSHIDRKSLNISLYSQLTSFVFAFIGILIFVILFMFVKPKMD